MTAVAASPRRIGQDFRLDPITFSPITDPVIDECGHTFDRATIAMLTAEKPVGTPIICPFSRQVIDTNKLVVNLFAREAVDYVNHVESRLEHLANQIQEASIRQEQSNKKFEMIFEQLLAEKEVATKSRDKTEQAFLECHQSLISGIEHYRPSIQYFQKDRLDGETKITLMVDRSQLTPKAEHPEKQTLRIIDLAINLKDRLTAVEIDQARIKQEQAQIAAGILEVQLSQSSIQGLIHEVRQLLPTVATPEQEQIEVSRPPDKKIARQSAEALPRVRDDSVRETKRPPPKQTKTAAPAPSLLEKFLGFLLTCLNKINNWFRR